MEYIPGKTLHAVLAAERPPIETLLGYAVQAARAVAAASYRGIVHRDLKTKNIMVTETRHSQGARLRPRQADRHRRP